MKKSPLFLLALFLTHQACAEQLSVDLGPDRILCDSTPFSLRASCAHGGTPGRLPILSLDEATATLPIPLRAADEDPDRDGLSNLIGFAFASDPAAASAAPVTAHQTTGELHLTFRRPYDTFERIDYILETSTDLQTWIPATTFDLTLTPLPDGTQLSSYAVPTLPNHSASFRIRIEMTSP